MANAASPLVVAIAAITKHALKAELRSRQARNDVNVVSAAAMAAATNVVATVPMVLPHRSQAARLTASTLLIQPLCRVRPKLAAPLQQLLPAKLSVGLKARKKARSASRANAAAVTATVVTAEKGPISL